MLTNLTRSNVYTGTDQSTDDILTKYDPANKILPDSTSPRHHGLQIFPLIFGQKVGRIETTTTTALSSTQGFGRSLDWDGSLVGRPSHRAGWVYLELISIYFDWTFMYCY